MIYDISILRLLQELQQADTINQNEAKFKCQISRILATLLIEQELQEKYVYFYPS